MDFFEELKNAIREASLESDITLAGHRSDLREVMSVSDVVISLSTDPEAFGRVTLEALSPGKPVVGYDHGGVKEQLDALFPNGKVRVGDIRGMIETLSQLSQSPSLPNKENPFTLERMLTNLMQQYS